MDQRKKLKEQVAEFISNKQFEELNSVSVLDLKKYMGVWYEIGTSFFVRLFIETLCTCTKAEYSLNPDGTVKVFNSCRVINQDGNLRTATGVAKQENILKPGQLTVSFGNMVSNKPNYYIIHLDIENGKYKHALIGEPSRLFLWILSRKPKMSQSDYDRLLKIAEQNGFDVNAIQFRKTKQDCEKYDECDEDSC